jgi:branched-chain amino acid transport system ATP-binding protein
MGEILLRLEGVKVVYKKVIVAIEGVSLAVPRGAIVALLGTNGAGKTTALRAISGFIGLDDARVAEGAIVHRGTRIENWPPHRVARRGIVLVPERNKVFETLTVAENLAATVPRQAARAERRAALERAYAYFPRLGELKARQAGYLSGGERQMLALGAALAAAPELLLVDELSLGLAPIVVEQLALRLAAIRAELGVTILLVEQNAEVALDLADHAYVLENGRIVIDGAPETLRRHQDIREFYLGTAGAGAGRRSYRAVKQYRRSRRWYG